MARPAAVDLAFCKVLDPAAASLALDAASLAEASIPGAASLALDAASLAADEAAATALDAASAPAAVTLVNIPPACMPGSAFVIVIRRKRRTRGWGARKNQAS